MTAASAVPRSSPALPRRGVPPFGSHSTHTTAEECCHPPAGGGRTIDSQ
jgi:hypothetical protein